KMSFSNALGLWDALQIAHCLGPSARYESVLGNSVGRRRGSRPGVTGKQLNLGAAEIKCTGSEDGISFNPTLRANEHTVARSPKGSNSLIHDAQILTCSIARDRDVKSGDRRHQLFRPDNPSRSIKDHTATLIGPLPTFRLHRKKCCPPRGFVVELDLQCSS